MQDTVQLEIFFEAISTIIPSGKTLTYIEHWVICIVFDNDIF